MFGFLSFCLSVYPCVCFSLFLSFCLTVLLSFSLYIIPADLNADLCLYVCFVPEHVICICMVTASTSTYKRNLTVWLILSFLSPSLSLSPFSISSISLCSPLSYTDWLFCDLGIKQREKKSEWHRERERKKRARERERKRYLCVSVSPILMTAT